MTKIINGGNTMPDSTEVQENNTSQIVENANSVALPPTETLLANVQAATSDNSALESSNAIPQLPVVNPTTSPSEENPADQDAAEANNVRAATCETCASNGANGASPQLFFALGQLGFDYGTEARRDSIMQHMDEPANPNDPNQLLTYLKKNPWDATSILWTLNLDATPIYAVQAQGAFARETCQRLCEFLGEQTCGAVERVSIPGYSGGSARLSNGQTVPVIWPDLRGMYSWNNKALVKAVCGDPPTEKAPQKEKDGYVKKAQTIANFLQRVYEELRNLGTTPQERAINYAATNALQAAAVFNDAIESGMDLDTIEVERSPVCRPESDCWDVKLTFFNPSKVFEQARKVYLFTVDVSDVVPVMVGSVRSWFVR
jgi:cyanobactin maturation PatA/PatG family protease